jgi:hypothetical protein
MSALIALSRIGTRNATRRPGDRMAYRGEVRAVPGRLGQATRRRDIRAAVAVTRDRELRGVPL